MSLLKSIARGRALALWLLLGLLACVSNKALAAEEAAKLTPGDPDGNGFGSFVAVSGDYIVVGAPRDSDLGIGAGAAYIFKHVGETWVQQIKLRASDGGFEGQFGSSVAIDGDLVVVGAPELEGFDGGPGAAYVFRLKENVWTEEVKLTAPVPTQGDIFGRSVSVSGDFIVVGKPATMFRVGFAHVFRWNGDNWLEDGILTGSDTEPGDRFGISVSVAGNLLIVGASVHDSATGAAYVFRRGDGGWIQEAKLAASDSQSIEYFGHSVAASTEWIVVGAPYFGAYLFQCGVTDCTQRCKLIPSDVAGFAGFGAAVSAAGDLLVVGAPAAESYSGWGYAFRRLGAEWVEVDRLLRSDPSSNRRLGRSVSVDGGWGVQGAAMAAFVYALPADVPSHQTRRVLSHKGLGTLEGQM